MLRPKLDMSRQFRRRNRTVKLAKETLDAAQKLYDARQGTL